MTSEIYLGFKDSILCHFTFRNRHLFIQNRASWHKIPLKNCIKQCCRECLEIPLLMWVWRETYRNHRILKLFCDADFFFRHPKLFFRPKKKVASEKKSTLMSTIASERKFWNLHRNVSQRKFWICNWSLARMWVHKTSPRVSIETNSLVVVKLDDNQNIFWNGAYLRPHPYNTGIGTSTLLVSFDSLNLGTVVSISKAGQQMTARSRNPGQCSPTSPDWEGFFSSKRCLTLPPL